MLILTLLACQPVPLAEVPIVGGSDAQQAWVRATVRVFDDAAGPGRVTLRRIELRPLQPGVLGSYDPTAQRIEFDEHDLRTGTVFHELTHAIVDQDRLQRAASPVTEELTVFAKGEGQLDHVHASRRGEFSESIALMGGLGPHWASERLRQDCDESPDDALGAGLPVDVAQWMRDQVWSNFEAPLAVELGAPVTLAGVGARVDATTHPGIVYIDGVDGPSWVDLYTGHSDGVPHPAVIDSQFAFPAGLAVYASPQSAGFPEGTATLRSSWAPLPFPTGPSREMAFDGAAWGYARGDGCPGSVADMFTADGQTWVAWSDEGQLTWAPILPQ